MKVQAYKCRFTGQLFDSSDRDKFISHLKELREELKDKREDRRVLNGFEKLLQDAKENIYTIPELEAWVIKNQKNIWRMVRRRNGNMSSKKKYPIMSELLLSVKYSPEVSNSHSCPRGGVQNWCARNKGYPTSYPGFHGRINFTCVGRYDGFMNDFFDLIDIHTGTGGAGDTSFSYAVSLFTDDWVGLGQSEAIKRLKFGANTPNSR